MTASVRLREIAELLNGSLIGDPEKELTSAVLTRDAVRSALVIPYTAQPRSDWTNLDAGALLLPFTLFLPRGENYVLLERPVEQDLDVLNAFLHERGFRSYEAVAESSIASSADVAGSAVIEANAVIGEDTVIGHGVVIGADVRIGRGCRIGDYAQIGDGVRVGDRTVIEAGAVVGVHGGQTLHRTQGWVEVPTLGSVVIGNDSIIGPGVLIDRGTVGDTVIGSGTRIAGMSIIGHEARISDHCLILARSSIAGWASVGDRAVVCANAAVNNWAAIGRGARLMAMSGAAKDVPDGEVWIGIPARPYGEWMRKQAKQTGGKHNGRSN